MKSFTGGYVSTEFLQLLSRRAANHMFESVIGPRAIAELQERLLADARRFDVGHEIILPERARSDHR